MNGQSSQRRSQTREGWNGCDFGSAQSAANAPAQVSCLAHPRAGDFGPKPRAERQDECQPSSDKTERWPVAPRDLPLGSRYLPAKDGSLPHQPST